MRVFKNRRVGRLNRESATHPEVDVEPVPVVEREDDALAAARDVIDNTAREMRREINVDWMRIVFASELHSLNPRGYDPGTQGVDDGLNFREFGHPVHRACVRARTTDRDGWKLSGRPRI